MSNKYFVFIACAILIFATVLGCSKQKITSDSMVPDGVVTADVMTLQINQRGQKLFERFQVSISQNPQWWAEHIKKAIPGEPLPYDPRLGLSKSEYSEMLSLMNQMTLNKVGEVSLEFIPEGRKRYRVSCPELEEYLTDVHIDLENDWVDTPFGRLNDRGQINNTDPDSPTGPWTGARWRLEDPSDQEPFGTVALFSLGRRTEDHRSVLYYKVRRVLPEQQPVKIDLLLFYDLS